MAALKTRQIDGMIVEANAGYKMEEDGSGRVLVQFGDRIKIFHIYVFYARKGFLEKNPEAVRAFLAGWFETIGYMAGIVPRRSISSAAPPRCRWASLPATMTN